MNSYKHKIAIVIALVVIVLVMISASAESSSSVVTPGPTATTGLPIKKPPTCSTRPASAYNKLLKRRSFYTGHKVRKFRSKLVCFKPTYINLKKSLKQAKSRCMKSDCYWRIKWLALPASDRAWAISTGSCESGNDPTTNTGNGFSGAFQYDSATATEAGFIRPPHETSWYEQAVRSVWLMYKTSDERWPVCGD